MTLPNWREEATSRARDAKSFDYGDAAMNDFLRRYARQSHEQNAAKTLCAIDIAMPGSKSSRRFQSRIRRCRRR